MTDERTDSDLIALKKAVDKHTGQNSEEHRAIMNSVNSNAGRIDRLTMIQEDQQRLIVKYGTTLYGNGKVGLAEDVRVGKAFNSTLIKLLWVAATVGTAAAVTGFISLAKQALTP